MSSHPDLIVDADVDEKKVIKTLFWIYIQLTSTLSLFSLRSFRRFGP